MGLSFFAGFTGLGGGGADGSGFGALFFGLFDFAIIADEWN